MKHKTEMTRIRLLHQIIDANQKKIDALIESGLANSADNTVTEAANIIVADCYDNITIARKEILDIRNERIQNLFKKKKNKK